MRRSSVLLLTLILALATALALLAAGSALGDAQLPAPTRSEQRSVVFRFYDAVNLALRTGDGSGLAEAVADDLVTHDAFGVGQDRRWLEHRLAELRAADPSAQLVVEDLVVEGDRAAVRVRAQGGRDATFLGMPVDPQPAAWAPIDLLRVADGKVAERWAVGDAGVLLRPVLRAELDARAADAASLGLARFTVAPGAVASGATNPTPVLFAVEAGALRVRVEGPAPPTPASAPATGRAGWADQPAGRVLRPGDALVVPAGARFELGNDGQTPAVALAAALTAALVRPGAVLHAAWPPGAGREGLAGWPPGVTVRTLATGPVMSLPPGPLAVAVGRLTVAPGTALPPHAARGVELLAVESGRLGLAATAPSAVFDRGHASTPSPGGTEGIAPDGSGSEAELTRAAAAALYGGAVASLRAIGADPLVVWVVTVTPAEPKRTT